MKLKTIGMAVFAAAVVLSGTAMAATGYTATAMRLRAGPGTDYPVVARIPANARVRISGCVEGWNWCDVSYRGIHGWTSGRLLQAVSDTRRLPVYGNGPVVGLPVVVFTQQDYWDRYYRGRPFYRNHGPDRGRGPDDDHDHDRGDYNNHGHWDHR